MTDKLVGRALKQLREEQGLTQTQVAMEYDGGNQSTVSKLESGVRSLYLRESRTYAAALGIGPELLFYEIMRTLADHGHTLA